MKPTPEEFTTKLKLDFKDVVDYQSASVPLHANFWEIEHRYSPEELELAVSSRFYHTTMVQPEFFYKPINCLSKLNKKCHG